MHVAVQEFLQDLHLFRVVAVSSAHVGVHRPIAKRRCLRAQDLALAPRGTAATARASVIAAIFIIVLGIIGVRIIFVAIGMAIRIVSISQAVVIIIINIIRTFCGFVFLRVIGFIIVAWNPGVILSVAIAVTARISRIYKFIFPVSIIYTIR